MKKKKKIKLEKKEKKELKKLEKKEENNLDSLRFLTEKLKPQKDSPNTIVITTASSSNNNIITSTEQINNIFFDQNNQNNQNNKKINFCESNLSNFETPTSLLTPAIELIQTVHSNPDQYIDSNLSPIPLTISLTSPILKMNSNNFGQNFGQNYNNNSSSHNNNSSHNNSSHNNSSSHNNNSSHNNSHTPQENFNIKFDKPPPITSQSNPSSTVGPLQSNSHDSLPLMGNTTNLDESISNLGISFSSFYLDNTQSTDLQALYDALAFHAQFNLKCTPIGYCPEPTTTQSNSECFSPANIPPQPSTFHFHSSSNQSNSYKHKNSHSGMSTTSESSSSSSSSSSLWNRFVSSFLPITVYNTQHVLSTDDVHLCGYILPMHLTKLHAYSNVNYVFIHYILTLIAILKQQQVRIQAQYQQQALLTSLDDNSNVEKSDSQNDQNDQNSQNNHQNDQNDQNNQNSPNNHQNNDQHTQTKPTNLPNLIIPRDSISTKNPILIPEQYPYLPFLPLLTTSNGVIVGPERFVSNFGSLPEILHFPFIHEFLRGFAPSSEFKDTNDIVQRFKSFITYTIPTQFYRGGKLMTKPPHFYASQPSFPQLTHLDSTQSIVIIDKVDGNGNGEQGKGIGDDGGVGRVEKGTLDGQNGNKNGTEKVSGGHYHGKFYNNDEECCNCIGDGKNGKNISKNDKITENNNTHSNPDPLSVELQPVQNKQPQSHPPPVLSQHPSNDSQNGQNDGNFPNSSKNNQNSSKNIQHNQNNTPNPTPNSKNQHNQHNQAYSPFVPVQPLPTPQKAPKLSKFSSLSQKTTEFIHKFTPRGVHIGPSHTYPTSPHSNVPHSPLSQPQYPKNTQNAPNSAHNSQSDQNMMHNNGNTNQNHIGNPTLTYQRDLERQLQHFTFCAWNLYTNQSATIHNFLKTILIWVTYRNEMVVPMTMVTFKAILQTYNQFILQRQVPECTHCAEIVQRQNLDLSDLDNGGDSNSNLDAKNGENGGNGKNGKNWKSNEHNDNIPLDKEPTALQNVQKVPRPRAPPNMVQLPELYDILSKQLQYSNQLNSAPLTNISGTESNANSTTMGLSSSLFSYGNGSSGNNQITTNVTEMNGFQSYANLAPPSLTAQLSLNKNSSLSLTSDSGWGCMLRSAQMLLSTTLSFHFSHDELLSYNPLIHTHNLSLSRHLSHCPSPDPDLDNTQQILPSNRSPISLMATFCPPPSYINFPVPSLRNSLQLLLQDSLNGAYSIHAMLLHRGEGRTPGQWYSPSEVSYMLYRVVQTARGDHAIPCSYKHMCRLYEKYNYYTYHGLPMPDHYQPIHIKEEIVVLKEGKDLGGRDEGLDCSNASVGSVGDGNLKSAEKSQLYIGSSTMQFKLSPSGARPFVPSRRRYGIYSTLSREKNVINNSNIAKKSTQSDQNPTKTTTMTSKSTTTTINTTDYQYTSVINENHRNYIQEKSQFCQARYPLTFGIRELTVCVCNDGEVYYHSILRRMLARGTVTPTLVLINVCLGLSNIEQRHYNTFLSMFKLCYNVGAFGGVKNSSLYFYGSQGERIFYLDPHTTQKATQDSSNNQDRSASTYQFNQLKSVHLKEIDPALSFGFYLPNTQALSLWFTSLLEVLSLTIPGNEHNGNLGEALEEYNLGGGGNGDDMGDVEDINASIGVHLDGGTNGDRPIHGGKYNHSNGDIDDGNDDDDDDDDHRSMYSVNSLDSINASKGSKKNKNSKKGPQIDSKNNGKKLTNSKNSRSYLSSSDISTLSASNGSLYESNSSIIPITPPLDPIDQKKYQKSPQNLHIPRPLEDVTKSSYYHRLHDHYLKFGVFNPVNNPTKAKNSSDLQALFCTVGIDRPIWANRVDDESDIDEWEDMDDGDDSGDDEFDFSDDDDGDDGDDSDDGDQFNDDDDDDDDDGDQFNDDFDGSNGGLSVFENNGKNNSKK